MPISDTAGALNKWQRAFIMFDFRCQKGKWKIGHYAKLSCQYFGMAYSKPSFICQTFRLICYKYNWSHVSFQWLQIDFSLVGLFTCSIDKKFYTIIKKFTCSQFRVYVYAADSFFHLCMKYHLKTLNGVLVMNIYIGP